jgi:Skp family chaperone for outer membrane proteins
LKKLERFLGFGAVLAIMITLSIGVFALTTRAEGETALPAGIVIGFVDDAKLDTTYPDIVKAKEEIKGFEEEASLAYAEFNQKVKSVQASIQRQYEDKTKDMTEEEKQKYLPIYEEMFNAESTKLKRELELKTMEIEAKAQAVWKAAYEKVKTTIEVVAKEEKVGLVLKKDIIWFGGVDLTEAVLKKASAQ